MATHHILSYLETLSADSPLTFSSIAHSPADVSHQGESFAFLQSNRGEFSDDHASLPSTLDNAELYTELEIHEQLIKTELSDTCDRPDRITAIQQHILRLRNIAWPTTRSTDCQGSEPLNVPPQSNIDGNGSFATARSHLTPSSAGPPTAREPEATTAERPENQGSINEPRRPQPRRRRPQQHETWRELPRVMGSRYTVSGIQNCLAGSALGHVNKQNFTRLFFAIASPYAMVQLQEILAAMARNEIAPQLARPDSIRTALASLDKLSSLQLLSRFQARTCLLTILQLYTTRKNEMMRHNSPSFVNRRIISSIIAEEYPYLDPQSSTFERHVANLQQRLYTGRNLYQLAKRFGFAIIAMLPWGGEFLIYDNIIHTPQEQYFNDFLNILDEKRGPFLRRCARMVRPRLRSLSKLQQSEPLLLENVDAEIVKGKQFDSEDLLRLLRCE